MGSLALVSCFSILFFNLTRFKLILIVTACYNVAWFNSTFISTVFFFWRLSCCIYCAGTVERRTQSLSNKVCIRFSLVQPSFISDPFCVQKRQHGWTKHNWSL